MTGTIRLSDRAQQDVGTLDRGIAKRIYRFLFVRLAKVEDPRSIGDALHGSKLGEYWKYRVGDYRLVCKIEDDQLVVLVLRVGHRREIYR
jgi:mRNA interferase RelE/StbE